MALVAALNTAPPQIDFTASMFIVSGTITVSGNYGSSSSHGDTLDLSVLGVPATGVPWYVDIFEAPAVGTSQSGWLYQFTRGTTQKNGVMQVFGFTDSSAEAGLQGLTEYTEGSAYSSASPAVPTTLNFIAFFPKL